MNLIPVAPIRPDRDEGRRVLCIKCGIWTPIETAFADVDGKPFEAYYCPACAHPDCIDKPEEA